MCGRYTYKLSWKQIVELYRLTSPDKEPEGLAASYNVAPTHVMPIIRPAGNGRELVRAGWGLVPYWLKPEQLSKSQAPAGSNLSLYSGTKCPARLYIVPAGCSASSL